SRSSSILPSTRCSRRCPGTAPRHVRRGFRRRRAARSSSRSSSSTTPGERSGRVPPRTRNDFQRIIVHGLGPTNADLVIKNARILDPVGGGLERSDIAICGDRIVGTYESYDGTTEIDAEGRVAVPGFIDTHVHCESTLVTPPEFARCILPRGTT